MKIMVVGDVILDVYITGNSHKLSPEAPIPVVMNPITEYKAGGAANVAKNLASLGVTVELHGIIGRDREAQRLIETISVPNIHAKLEYNDDNPTTTKTRVASNDQQIVRIDKELHDIKSINNTASNVVRNVYDSSFEPDFVIVSDYGKGVITPLFTHTYTQSNKPMLVLVDPKNKMSNYRGAWLVKPNEKEFFEYFTNQDMIKYISLDKLNSHSLSLIRSEMKKNSIANLLITRGKKGMILVTAKDVEYFESEAQSVYDVTGAGDTVMAIIAYHLCNNLSLKESIQKANKVAAKAVKQAGNYIANLKDVQETTVFTNGCFDILHPGHIECLKKSKSLGDRLVVGLNSDSSVRRLKGDDRPFNNQNYRKMMLESLAFVDEVVVFDEDTPYELIYKLKPDIITKGGDYQIKDVVGHDMAKVVILPLVDNHSTTNIINRLREDATE